MLTAVWSHSHWVQCVVLGEPAENQARASRYFPALNGSLFVPSKCVNTRLVSGLGAPQHGMIRPVASIAMFLYNQWQVWTALGGGSSAAAGIVQDFSESLAIRPASRPSGSGFQFSGRLEIESQSKRRCPAFTGAGRMLGSSQRTSNGLTTRNRSTPSLRAVRAASGISCALCSNARKFQDNTGARLHSMLLALTSFRMLSK